jgi:hypothetical protein
MRSLNSLGAAIFVASSLIAGTLRAETGPIAALRSGKGLTVIWNESAAHFQLEVPCESFKADRLGRVFSFFVKTPNGNRFFQVIAADIKDFAPSGGEARAILEQHMAFESKSWQESVSEKMETAIVKSWGSGIAAMLLWEIRWPEAHRKKYALTSLKQMFITRLVGDRVAIVSTSVEPEDSGEVTVKWLTTVGDSIVVSASTIDPERVQRSTKENAKPKRD